MVVAPPLDAPDRIRCPVCRHPTVTAWSRIQLAVFVTFRCPVCMAKLQLAEGSWLYRLPLELICAAEVLLLLALGILHWHVWVAVASLAGALAFTPCFLRTCPRDDDPITGRAIKRWIG